MHTKLLTFCMFTALCSSAFSAVTYSTDATSSLVGSFTYDVVNDGLGTGTTIAAFPHFHLDPLSEGYTSGDSQVIVRLGTPGAGTSTIILEAEDFDIGFGATASASEDYTFTTGTQPASFPDQNGIFTSVLDNTTQIAYSYTNVGFSSPDIFSGNFSFTIVPEPSGALFGMMGVLAFLRRKR